jgi:outer membrane protein assembly factor BamB
MVTRPALIASFLCLVLLGPSSPAEEWTRYRGPNGSGLSEAADIPVTFSAGSINWKAKLPGEGHSQPVFWGDRIYITSAEDGGARRLVLCLRAANGEAVWSKDYRLGTHPKHQRNTYASSTPAVDGERVYTVFSVPESLSVFALDHGGKELWKRDLGAFKSQHGNGSSPIVFEDLLVIGDEQDGESSLVALDRKSGEVRWRTPRLTAEVAYGTPCVYEEAPGRPAFLFSSHAHGLSSIDPRTGAANWEARVFDKRTVSSPIFAGGLCIGTCGSGGGGSFVVAVKPGGKGDVTESRVAYKLTRAMPYVPTPVARGDLLFMWGDMGVVTCAELATGKVVWQERAAGNYSGSPIAIRDRLYGVSDDGEVVVLAAGREFKVLGRSPLGEESRSTPAVAGGRLFVRTLRHLFSIGGPAGGKAASREAGGAAPGRESAGGAGGARG